MEDIQVCGEVPHYAQNCPLGFTSHTDRTQKGVATGKYFWDGSLRHREVEVIYEVSCSNRNCHNSSQKKLRGTDSLTAPSTVAKEQPSLRQVGTHLGWSAVLGLKDSATTAH